MRAEETGYTERGTGAELAQPVDKDVSWTTSAVEVMILGLEG